MSSSPPWRIVLSSPPDRERLVAEIFFGNDQWAEINQETEIFGAEFYPKPDGRDWVISLADAMNALEEAKKTLEKLRANPKVRP